MRNRFSLDDLYQRLVKGVLLFLRLFDNEICPDKYTKAEYQRIHQRDSQQ